MSLATHREDYDALDEVDYRALSAPAVASLVAGVLSCTAFAGWIMGAIPLVGILLGVAALWRIGQQPESLTGARLAWTGITLSALFWASGAGWLAYEYAHEVPEGYTRITYAELQPEPGAAPDTVPTSARRLDGQRVFIKGFAYPGKQSKGIEEFILCRDKGTCCFGGPSPKLTDMIQIHLKNGLKLDHSLRVQKLAGTFRVETSAASDDLGRVLYHLDAEYLK
ncbi:MAG: DUF4190 domain-containing protein [Pirellulales bacterium]|nr:DUF4190 domain-containing protein [Pirellulales bacterium]